MATPTQRALVSSVADSISGGSSWAFTLPNTGNGAAVGQLGVLILARSGGTSTTNDLSGWNPLTGTPTTGTASGGQFYIWTKTLASGDLGSVVNFTTSTVSRYAAACLVVDPAAVDISGITETQTSGTVMASPSVDPTATDGLLITIFGPIVNALSTPVTWTATAPITEIVDISSNSGTARNATMLVATEVLSSGAVTGTRTGTPTGNVQRQTISLVLASTPHAVLGATALAFSGTAKAAKAAVESSGGAVVLATASIMRKVAVGGGSGSLNLSVRSNSAKRATPTSSSSFALSSSGTEQKHVLGGGSATLSLVAAGLLQRRTAVSGVTVLTLAVRDSGNLSVRSVVGLCSLALGARGTPRRLVTFSATNQGFYPGPDTYPGPTLFPGLASEAVLFAEVTISTASAVGRGVSGISTLAFTGYSAQRKTAPVVGSSLIGISTTGFAHRAGVLAGRGGLSLTATGVAHKVIAAAGACSLVQSTSVVTIKRAVINGRATVTVDSVGLVRKTVVGRGITVLVTLTTGAPRKRAAATAATATCLTCTGRVGRYALSGTVSVTSVSSGSLTNERSFAGRCIGAMLVDGELTIHLPIRWGLMSNDDQQVAQMTRV